MTRHLIDELVFDIAFDSNNKAMQADSYLSQLLTATLLPVVEEVFDGLDDGDTVLLLPSLELDLGDIAQSDFEDLAPRRLRAALDDGLRRELASARQARESGGTAARTETGDGRAASIISRQESELARLARFLDTGTLPWDADIGHAQLHETLLGRLLVNGGEALWAVLARALANPRSARRLVEQFPEHQLFAVLRGSAGAGAGHYQALLAEAKLWPSGAEDKDPVATAWVQVLAATAGNAAAQVDPRTECARIRAMLAPSSVPANAPFLSDIELLADFLGSGQLRIEPDSAARQPAHEALLDRVLALGGESLSVLARALANPNSARRLAEQFPEHQLLAALRGWAGAGAGYYEALLAEARLWPSGADRNPVTTAWMQVLAAAAGNASAHVDPQAECARIRAMLAPISVPANAPSLSDIELLADFLDRGQLRIEPDSAARQPAHEALLDRVLAHGGESVCAGLARALANPRNARRLVERFPEHQLLAVLRRTAGTDAAKFEALLAEAKLRPSGSEDANLVATVWTQVLASAAGNASAHVDPQAEYARIGATLAPVSVQATAPSLSDIELLVDFLDSGQLPIAPDSAARQPAHEALLDRLLSLGGQPLWAELARSLANPRSARRFVEQFPEHQLLAVLHGLAGACAGQPDALLAEARQWLHGAEDGSLMARAWAQITASCNGATGNGGSQRIECVSTDAHEASMDGWSEPDGGSPARTALSRTLVVPVRAKPRVILFFGRSRRALQRQASVAHRVRQRAALAPGNARARPTSMTWRRGHADSTQGRRTQSRNGQLTMGAQPMLQAMPGLLQLLAGLVRGRQLGTERQMTALAPARRPGVQASTILRGEAGRDVHAPDNGTGRTVANGAQSHRLRLQDLALFLENGLLPNSVGVGADEPHAHEALLDDLLAQAGDDLWPVIARALGQPGSAGRLLAQFPARQLIALARKSAPGYAPALERLVPRVSPMSAARFDSAMSDAPLMQVCWRHILAACVDRPAIRALPAVVYAKIALELDGSDRGAPASAGDTAYAHRIKTDARPWRGSLPERKAGRALVRLAGLMLRFRPLAGTEAYVSIDASLTAETGGGLVLRRREQMARWLNEECHKLEGILLGEKAATDALNDISNLLNVISAHVNADSAIDQQRRPVLLDAIEAKARDAADPGDFLRGVIAALANGEPLDLDQIIAREQGPAAAIDPGPEHLLRALAAALKCGDGTAMSGHWQTLLRQHGPAIRGGLHQYGRSASVRRALAHGLPEPLLIGLVGLLDGDAPAILHELLAPSARLQAAVGTGFAWTQWQQRCRAQALDTLLGAAPGVCRLDASSLLHEVARHDSELHGKLLKVLPAQFRTAPKPVARQSSASVTPVREAAAPPVVAAAVDSREFLVVGNAGMVLAAPFLPRLFSALGLTVDGKFTGDHAAARAVHLVQYMVNGESRSPEYQLVLNKILCGLPTGAPVPAGIVITAAEQESIEGMIQAMVAHWKALGNSSVAAMRQTFFARKADLQLIEDAWQLRVHPGTFDMLLDRLPWGYSVIKFSWMARPVHVDWR